MKNLILTIVTLLLVCCGEVEATNNTTNEVIKPVVRKVYTHPVEINLDDMTFTNAFRVQYLAKGEGSTFWWRNSEYTTNLAQITVKPDEFVVKHVGLDVSTVGWVRNNDDPNDDCRSNVLDDCGICNGPGKVTWFRDKDGDGLGTFMEWITSCTYPTTVEIEKYQAESLLEGGGDQGY